MTEYDAQVARRAPSESEQNGADEVGLQAALFDLASIVADDRGPTTVLAEVAALAMQAIPGVDGLGVTVLQVSDATLGVHASEVTAPFVRQIDILQYEVLHDGPGITCMQTQRASVSGALGTDARWPRFGARAAGIGVESVLSLPLSIGDQVIGSIDCYARGRDAFGDDVVRLGSTFARPAAVTVYNAQQLAAAQEAARQLQDALVSRKAIDQAIGIIRSRTGASADDALNRLIRISQTNHVELTVTAQRLVEQAVHRSRMLRP